MMHTRSTSSLAIVSRQSSVKWPTPNSAAVARAFASVPLAWQRELGADPTEVAKYNGLLPNSVLGAGREIKIPTK